MAGGCGPQADSTHVYGSIELSTFFVVVRRSSSVPSPAVEESGAEAPIMRLPGLDEIEQKSWREFVRSTTDLLSAMNRDLMGRHRLDLLDFRLLELLAKSDTGSARMGELAEVLMLLRSRVTWLTRRLEARGLLRRARIPGDGRGVRAEITAAGRVRLDEARKTYAEQIRRLYVNQMRDNRCWPWAPVANGSMSRCWRRGASRQSRRRPEMRMRIQAPFGVFVITIAEHGAACGGCAAGMESADVRRRRKCQCA